MTNPIVIQWIGDQTVAIIELLTAVICFCIIVHGLRNGGDFHHHFPKSFKVAIYCVYISTIIHSLSILSNVIALPIASAIYPPSTRYQSDICWGTFFFVLPAFVIMQTAIINLFIIRLDIAFQNTDLALSKCTNYAFRVGYPFIMTLILIATGFSIKPYPYDIYKNRVDLHGNGVTCSAFVSSEPNPPLVLCIGLIGLGLVTANITVWILFMKRLYKLVKLEHSLPPSDGKAIDVYNDQFIVLMKEQTFIVCVAVFTTVFAWGFQSLVAWGAITAPIDIAVTTFVIFLSFKFNRRYFDMLKCGVLTNICCGICCKRFVETKIISKNEQMMVVMNPEMKASKSSTSTGATVTETVSSSVSMSSPKQDVSVATDVIIKP